jgi:putative heme-binding domain-containing protein
LHPYTAWNGEIPGTLPMVAGTGEAPSGILDCDKTAFPGDFEGALLVTSWGDHALEIYRPKPYGASVRAEREVLVQGDEWFRPVGIAAAPNGDVYFTDWVDRDYSVHRKGRIWKLSAKEKTVRNPKPTEKSSARERMLHPRVPDDLEDSDPFIRSAAVSALSQEQAWKLLESSNSSHRLGGMIALRHAGLGLSDAAFTARLSDTNESIRLLTLIWIGEQNRHQLATELPKALDIKPVSPALFRTFNKTYELLRGHAHSTRIRQKTIVDLAVQETFEDFPLDTNGRRVNKTSLPTGIGDVERGRRLFFHQTVGCAKCHRIEDRGGNVGPDLSVVARSSSREKLMQSIIEPSREMAPQFLTHMVDTIDGETWSGMLENEDRDGSLTLTTADGKGVFLPWKQIRARGISKVSLMPEGLEQALSEREFLDLIEFLSSRK